MRLDSSAFGLSPSSTKIAFSFEFIRGFSIEMGWQLLRIDQALSALERKAGNGNQTSRSTLDVAESICDITCARHSLEGIIDVSLLHHAIVFLWVFRFPFLRIPLSCLFTFALLCSTPFRMERSSGFVFVLSCWIRQDPGRTIGRTWPIGKLSFLFS